MISISESIACLIWVNLVACFSKTCVSSRVYFNVTISLYMQFILTSVFVVYKQVYKNIEHSIDFGQNGSAYCKRICGFEHCL